MKIQSIEITNLNSLSGTHLINFEDKNIFTESLFIICGQTGAGKTTILDAISIALYNKSPRLKDVNEAISKGFYNSKVVLRFSINDKSYKIIREWGKREKDNKNDFNEAKLFDETNNLISGQKVTDFNAQIEQITNLKYEQFSKTILLPQGEFVAFLKADPKDKVQILAKLTNEDVLKQIEIRTNDKYIEIKREFDRLEEIKANIKLFDEGELNAINIENERVKQVITDLGTKKLSLEAKLTLLRQISDLSLSIKQKKFELNQLLVEKEGIKPEVDKLSKSNLLEPLRSDLNLMDNKLREKQANNLVIEDALEKQKELNLGLITLKDSLEEMKTQFKKEEGIFDNVKERYQKALFCNDELNELLKSSNSVFSNLKSRFKEDIFGNLEASKLDQKWEELVEKYDLNLDVIRQLVNYQDYPQYQESLLKALDTWSKSNEQVEKLFSELVNFEINYDNVLKEIKSNNDESNSLTTKISDLKTDLNNEKEELSIIQSKSIKKSDRDNIINKIQSLRNLSLTIEGIEHLKSKIHNLNIEHLNFESEIKIIEETRFGLISQMEVLTSTKQEIILVQKLSEINIDLVDGKPCPICGSVDHHLENASLTKEWDQNELIKVDQDIMKMQNDISLIDEKCNKIKIKCATLKNEVCNSEIAIKENFESIHYIVKDLGLNSDLKMTDQINNLVEELQLSLENDNKLEEIIANKTKIILHTDNDLIALKEKMDIKIQLGQKLDIKSLDLSKNIESWKLQINNYQDSIEKTQKSITSTLTELDLETEGEDLESFNTLIEFHSNQSNRFNKANTYVMEFDKMDSLFKQVLEVNKRGKEKREEFNRYFMEDGLVNMESITNFYRTKLEHLEANKTALEETIKDVNLKQSELDNLGGQIQSLNQQKNDLDNDITLLESKLISEGLLLGLNSITEVKTSLLSLEEKAKIELLLKTIQDKIVASNRSLKDTEDQLHELILSKGFNENEQELLESLDSIKNEIEVLQKKSNEFLAQLAVYNSKKEEYIKINHQITYHLPIYNDWKLMYNYICVGRFTAFAHYITCNVLVGYANEQLKTLSGRYSLVAKSIPSNRIVSDSTTYLPEIFIIDHFQADAERSVQTLSGGESFLVSLALALSLSKISGKNLRYDTLFIDEGFGTLDPQCLNDVMDTLENLQSQGRLIGIISHVEELKNRINTQIFVDNRGGKSVIKFLKGGQIINASN